MNGLLGLDYNAVAWVLKLYAVEDQRAMLEDLPEGDLIAAAAEIYLPGTRPGRRRSAPKSAPKAPAKAPSRKA